MSLDGGNIDTVTYQVIGLTGLLALLFVVIGYRVAILWNAYWERWPPVDHSKAKQEDTPHAPANPPNTASVQPEPPPSFRTWVWQLLGDAEERHRFHSYKKVCLVDLMGTATWDFSTSWASNLTVVGALLGTALSAALGTLQHSTLNLLFLLLAFLAPLAYAVLGRQVPVIPTQAQEQQSIWTIVRRIQDAQQPTQLLSYQYQGYVWGFLCACLFTVWAVLGELATLFLLSGDLPTTQPKQHFSIIGGFQVFLVLAGLFLLYYCLTNIPWTLQAQVGHKEVRKAEAERFRTQVQSETALKVERSVRAAMPSWALL